MAKQPVSLKEIILSLKYAYENGLGIREASKHLGKGEDFLRNWKQNTYPNVKLKSTAEETETFEQYWALVTKRTFKLTNVKEAPLEVTAEDLQKIKELYCSQGADLSSADVARYFPQFNVVQFRKLLRNYRITKASNIFTTDDLKTMTDDEIIERIEAAKVERFNRSAQSYEVRAAKNVANKAIYQLKEYTEKREDFLDEVKELVQNGPNEIRYEPIEFKVDEINTRNRLILYLSDMHIGCFVSDESVFYSGNPTENFDSKLRRVLFKTDELIRRFKIQVLTIVNLGDALDGMDKTTSRRDVNLPQDLSNRQQFMKYFESIRDFVGNLKKVHPDLGIGFYSVDCGNHDGDFGWIANKTLAMYLESHYGADVRVADRSIEHVELGNHTFIFTHGKDKLYMKKNWPQHLDEKTTRYITDYMLSENLGKDHHVSVVKGDLHTSSTEYSPNFRYRNVGCFLGASQWTAANFGPGRSCVDYDLILGDDLMEGTIEL